MDMYSIKELADLYKTSRQTIYKKIRSEEMRPYVIDNESGIKVDKEGLNVLNAIMADSKVADKQVDNQNNNEVSHKLTNDHNTMLYSILQNQIDELRRDKQELQREKQELQREKTGTAD